MSTNLSTLLADLVMMRKFVDHSGIPASLVHKTERKPLLMLRRAVAKHDKILGTEDADAFDTYKDEIRDSFFWCMSNAQEMQNMLMMENKQNSTFNIICNTMLCFPNMENFETLTNRQFWWLFLYRCMTAKIQSRRLGFYLAEAVMYLDFLRGRDMNSVNFWQEV